MTHTENYNLNMPDDDDFFDAEHMNENMETIDTAMHDMEVKTADFEDKIGSSSDTGTTTIMGKLNKISEQLAKENCYYVPDTTNTFVLADSSSAPDISTTSPTVCVAGKPFKCEYGGYLLLNISATRNNLSDSSSDSIKLYILSNSSTLGNTFYTPGKGGSSMQYANLPHGTTISARPDGVTLLQLSYNESVSPNSTYTLTYNASVKVEKGDVIRIVLYGFGSNGKFTDISGTVKYGIKEAI